MDDTYQHAKTLETRTFSMWLERLMKSFPWDRATAEAHINDAIVSGLLIKV